MNRETPLYQQVIDALGLAGLAWVVRVHSGKVKVRGGWMQLAPTGTPDLLGYAVNGMAVGLEVKDPTSKRPARPEQTEWISRASRYGVIAEIVRGPQEAIDMVRAAVRGRAA